MAEAEGAEDTPRPRSLNRPDLVALQNLSLRHPLSVSGINYPGSWQFAEACRARQAAFDAKHQENPQRMDFDILTFTTVLTASEVTSPLIEELGCDKFINSFKRTCAFRTVISICGCAPLPQAVRPESSSATSPCSVWVGNQFGPRRRSFQRARGPRVSLPTVFLIEALGSSVLLPVGAKVENILLSIKAPSKSSSEACCTVLARLVYRVAQQHGNHDLRD
ncbi:PREDICTED: uncharacterized protein LOC103077614 [Lipotes vexillifer]|uniref:Uncharacterized protein LOC103077614 n=1 Tax=Lipotes vexillifer TaxID=118797 RepID=A0A340YCX7_LIPVE|nr:PREDICTED: uncharacterized protein LOC103077614 [Lipotes vexillifer]